jgi:hypothetical protein
MKDRPTISELVEQVVYDDRSDSPVIAELRQRSEELRRAQGPLLADLAAAGFSVRSVWALIDPKLPKTSALPVLLDHFSRPYPPTVREGIARALGDLAAPAGWWDQVVALYRSERDEQVKSGLAAAMAQMATKHDLGKAIDLARDETNGSSRVHFLYTINRARGARSQNALLSFAEDPYLGPQAREYLKNRERAAERKKKRLKESNG